jgi:hypothetical protein
LRTRILVPVVAEVERVNLGLLRGGRVLQNSVNLLRRRPLPLPAFNLVSHLKSFCLRRGGLDVERSSNFFVAVPRDEASEDPLELLVHVGTRRSSDRLPTL